MLKDADEPEILRAALDRKSCFDIGKAVLIKPRSIAYFAPPLLHLMRLLRRGPSPRKRGWGNFYDKSRIKPLFLYGPNSIKPLRCGEEINLLCIAAFFSQEGECLDS